MNGQTWNLCQASAARVRAIPLKTSWLYGGTAVATFASWSPGIRIYHALDMDNHRYWVRVGSTGNWNNSTIANPAASIGGFGLPALLYASPGAGDQSPYPVRFGDRLLHAPIVGGSAAVRVRRVLAPERLGPLVL